MPDRYLPVEPFRSQFCEEIRRGACAHEIFGVAEAPAFSPQATPVSEANVQRELRRVGVHMRSLCPLLEAFVPHGGRALDVGCSSGGTTVALAMSQLELQEVVGIDVNEHSLQAGRLRAAGHGLPPERVHFEAVPAAQPLPFADGQFDLVTAVSVLEFITDIQVRQFMAQEMWRVTKPGGYIYVSVPNGAKLREVHTRRWFGNQLRPAGLPWSPTPRGLRHMFPQAQRCDVARYEARRQLRRLGLPGVPLPSLMARAALRLAPWQKLLLRKPL